MKNAIAQLADNEGESLILLDRHSGRCRWGNGKVRMVVRCNVTYEHMRHMMKGKTTLRNSTQGNPHILCYGTSDSWRNSEVRLVVSCALGNED